MFVKTNVVILMSLANVLNASIVKMYHGKVYHMEEEALQRRQLINSLESQNIDLMTSLGEGSEDAHLRNLWEALTQDRQVYCQVFIATRNPLIACQACSSKCDSDTLYKYANDNQCLVYIEAKLKYLMPQAVKQYSNADKLISYEDKVNVLSKCVDDLLDMQSRFKCVKNISTMVGVISELNKMQGHYAPQKTLAINASLTPEEQDRFNKLLEKYEKES